jgi:hypothetical protein
MDRVIALAETVQQAVFSYNQAVKDYKANGYAWEDSEKQAFGVVIVPDPDHPTSHKPFIMLMARVLGEQVVIDVDMTNKPLLERLLEAGIPRQQIILGYAGESNSGRG